MGRAAKASRCGCRSARRKFGDGKRFCFSPRPRQLVGEVGRSWRERRAICDSCPACEAVRALLTTWKKRNGACAWCCAAGLIISTRRWSSVPRIRERKAPVVYAAAAGEKVVLSGGRRLEGGRWGEANGRKAWVVDIPEVKEGRWRFRQLFVNGARRPRTRLPKQGEYRIESLPGYTGDFLRSPTKQFVYAPGDIVPTGAICRTWKSWGSRGGWTTGCRSRASNATDAHRHLRPPEPVCSPLGKQARALLGGERLRGTGHSRPMVSRSSTRSAVLSAATGRGDAVGRDHRTAAAAGGAGGRARGAPVHDLRLEGLSFAHTEWQPPADYASSLQAGIEVPGALCSTTPNDAPSPAAAIEHIGNYGVEVSVGCADIEITRNRITDIGAGGIRIGHFFSWETDGSGQTDRAGTPAQGRHAERPAQPADHGGRQRDRPLRAVYSGSGGRVRGRQCQQQGHSQPHPRPVLFGDLRGLGPGFRAEPGHRQHHRIQSRA